MVNDVSNMTRAPIKTNQDSAEKRAIRADLKYAISICNREKIAIVCECGSGSDIDFLLQYGFKIHGFDSEEEAFLICEQRLDRYHTVFLYKETFDSFNFPTASLVVTDKSLLFCSTYNFSCIWDKINRCLDLKGIFIGCFLGIEDSKARNHNTKEHMRSSILAFSESKIRGHFSNFEIMRLCEHTNSSIDTQGNSSDSHIFSIVARKVSA